MLMKLYQTLNDIYTHIDYHRGKVEHLRIAIPYADLRYRFLIQPEYLWNPSPRTNTSRLPPLARLQAHISKHSMTMRHHKRLGKSVPRMEHHERSPERALINAL